MLHYILTIHTGKRNENLFQKLSINKILRSYFVNVCMNVYNIMYQWMNGGYKIGMAFLIHLIHLS